jgi:beta-lactam-binding protein with PASTA domain
VNVKEAVKTLFKYNVTYSGSENKVISQSPKANTRLEETCGKVDAW